MRLCLLSLPGPVPGLPASWGQIGALLFFQGVKECYPPLSSLSPSSHYPAGPTQGALATVGVEKRCGAGAGFVSWLCYPLAVSFI